MIAVSPDGKLLVSVGTNTNGIVRFWDVAARKSEVFVQNIRAIAMSGDGNLLVTGGNDGVARVWARPSWKEVTAFKASGKNGCSLVFSGDSRTLAVMGGDGTVILWNSASRKEVGRMKAVGGGELAVGNHTIVEFADKDTLQLFDIGSKQLVSRKLLPRSKGRSYSATALALFPDGKTLAAGDWKGNLRVLEIATAASR